MNLHFFVILSGILKDPFSALNADRLPLSGISVNICSACLVTVLCHFGSDLFGVKSGGGYGTSNRVGTASGMSSFFIVVFINWLCVKWFSQNVYALYSCSEVYPTKSALLRLITHCLYLKRFKVKF